MTKYIVFNRTDGITTHQDSFSSVQEAEHFIEQFRLRFKAQGYYRDSRGNALPVEEVDLVIVPLDADPFFARDVRTMQKTARFRVGDRVRTRDGVAVVKKLDDYWVTISFEDDGRVEDWDALDLTLVSSGSRTVVKPYRRKDGTVVRSHGRKRSTR